MQEEFWESPCGFLWDHGWILLLAVVLAFSAYFSRAYWLPAPVDLCFTGDASLPLKEAIPAKWGDVDVLFAFDQTGSMSLMIDGAKSDAIRLMRNIAGRFGKQRFGLIGFSDYGDFPYAMHHPLTDDYDAVQTAIQGLTLVGGGDAPEAYGRAVYESYTDSDIGWEADSSRYLVIFGDSVPHDPDAGPDGMLETADDLIWADVLAELNANGIELIFVADPGIAGNPAILDDWQEWVSVTDGKAIRCIETDS